MMQRENQTDWLADLIEQTSFKYKGCVDGYLIKILGKSFKPETNIVTGSTSVLLANILEERGDLEVNTFDPYIDEEELDFKIGVYFIGTKHPQFINFNENYVIQFFILITTYVTLDFLSLVAYAVLANKLIVWIKANPKVINTISACVILIIALIIAFSQKF